MHVQRCFTAFEAVETSHFALAVLGRKEQGIGFSIQKLSRPRENWMYRVWGFFEFGVLGVLGFLG